MVNYTLFESQVDIKQLNTDTLNKILDNINISIKDLKKQRDIIIDELRERL